MLYIIINLNPLLMEWKASKMYKWGHAKLIQYLIQYLFYSFTAGSELENMQII